MTEGSPDLAGYRSDLVAPYSDEDFLHRYIDVLRDKLKSERKASNMLRDEARQAKNALAEHDPYTVSVFATFTGDDARVIARTAKRDGMTVGELVQDTVLRQVHDRDSDMNNDPAARQYERMAEAMTGATRDADDAEGAV